MDEENAGGLEVEERPSKSCLLFLTGSIYRRGARRWRKLYRVNGHIFQAKRFNRVSTTYYKNEIDLIFLTWGIYCLIKLVLFQRQFVFLLYFFANKTYSLSTLGGTLLTKLRWNKTWRKFTVFLLLTYSLRIRIRFILISSGVYALHSW